MTCVNTSAFFESPNFWELANEELERLPKDYLEEVHTKYLNEIYVNQSSQYDFGMLNSLNTGGVSKRSNTTTRFDETYIDKYRDSVQKFYGSA